MVTNHHWNSRGIDMSLQKHTICLMYSWHMQYILLYFRLSASILAHYPDMLGPQIVGRLLPLYSTHPKIQSLIKQCDEKGVNFCSLVPTHHCYHTPGGPLQYSLEGHPFAPYGMPPFEFRLMLKVWQEYSFLLFIQGWKHLELMSDMFITIIIFLWRFYLLLWNRRIERLK